MVQNGQNLTGLYKEILFVNSDIKFLHIEWRTPYPLTNFEDRLGLRASDIFFLQCVWIPDHLYTGLLPNSSRQLAELIVNIIPLE